MKRFRSIIPALIPLLVVTAAAELAVRLVGSSSDASQLVNASPTTIIWVEHGDEVVVHLDSVQVGPRFHPAPMPGVGSHFLEIRDLHSAQIVEMIGTLTLVTSRDLS